MLAHGWLPEDDYKAAQAAATVLEREVGNFAWAGLSYSFSSNCPEYPIFIRRRTGQAHSLRCLFGNPFRPVALHPLWVARSDSRASKLAADIYSDRAFGLMPMLADVLEDAGCTDADILAHCRGPGPHVLGCWVVDLLTGRE